ncbi:MAG TPA: DUF6600 domain-containing protein [Chitinophagaceae bacterium]
MKRILKTAALALLVTFGGSWQNFAFAQPGDYNDYGDNEVSYQSFYDELSPHGRWIDYPEYGYVWAPNGITGFRPYETGGHWVWTDDYEWMWVSDYSWGWAPFHYGRWFHDPSYGWMWMPGYEWAPAWVAWRDGGDYYGWAPLRPGFNIGINISIGGYNPPVDYWCFAPRRYISSPRIYNHCIDRSRNVVIINNTTIINNYGRRNNVFYNGPRRMDAERYAGRINPVRFRESSRPGRSQFRNNEVSVYRPRVRRDDNRQFTPRSFDRYERNGNNNGFGRDRDNNNNRGNGNNLPVRRERDDRISRRENSDARPQDNNNGGNRRFDRRDVTNRTNNGQQRGNDERRERRSFEQRNNEVRQQPGNNNNNDRRAERRNEFERNRNNSASQPNRREMRNDNRSERQPSQRADRQQQRQQGQVENRRGGNENREQRGGNNNNERGRSRRG